MKSRLGRTLKIVTDAFRVTSAFNAAARGKYMEALRTLDSLGEDTSKTYEVRLLKGAVRSHLAEHEGAILELESGVRAVRRSKRLSIVEANYLVAYAVQYWDYSARQIGLFSVTNEINELLRVNPFRECDVSARLRRKFPLKVSFSKPEAIGQLRRLR